jgi:LPXTG-motif cell wall-anchored protein
VSINRRTAIAVRTIGVASAAAALALGVAGSAFACSIADFTANVSCDQSSGQGVLTVHDTDGTRPVTITVKSDQGAVVAGPEKFTDKGDFTLTVPWASAGTHYQVLATVPGYFTDKPVQDAVTIPDEACGKPTTPPTTPPTEAPTTPATDTPTPTPTGTTAAPVVADTSSNAPSPAAGGSQNLAETGSSSSTPMIAGIAGALVVIGGGSVFMLRRRRPAAHH